MMWFQALYVAVGAALGAVVRWQVSLHVPSPWGTLVVNVVGGLLVGFLFALIDTYAFPSWLKLLLVTGFLGGLTTFSMFSFDAVHLLMEKQWLYLSVYLVGSLCVTLWLCWAMYVMTLRFLSS